MGRRIVDDLRKTRAFPWEPDSVELIETHISWVFLAGDRVVKVKRPVDYGFVDFTDVEQRRHFCLEEVRLNRRLTADVYLRAAPIVSTEHGHKVNGEGEIVDWCTVMRRLPGDRMLDRLLRSGAAPENLAELLADRLLPFHQRASSFCHHDADDYLAVVTENLDQLKAVATGVLAPLQLELIDSGMRRFLGEHRGRLSERFATWLRDGHGDLRTEHVCIEPDCSVQIFDCVEFSEKIRCADVASDLAFLLMDLKRLGAGRQANELLDCYRDAGFDLPDAVIRFYAAHRALVRAKVACLDVQNGAVEQRERRSSEAANYIHIATEAILPVRPVLIAVSGLSGSGKSTVAEALGRALGASVHASDRVRKQLAETPERPAAESPWRSGIYSDEWTARTYDRLRMLAREELELQRPTIIDATLLDNDERTKLAEMASNLSVPFLFIDTVCDEPVLRERIRRRQQQGDSASDAGEAIYLRQKAEVERDPPVIPSGAISVTVDTSLDGPANLHPVFEALAGADLFTPLSWDGSTRRTGPLVE